MRLCLPVEKTSALTWISCPEKLLYQ